MFLLGRPRLLLFVYLLAGYTVASLNPAHHKGTVGGGIATRNRPEQYHSLTTSTEPTRTDPHPAVETRHYIYIVFSVTSGHSKRFTTSPHVHTHIHTPTAAAMQGDSQLVRARASRSHAGDPTGDLWGHQPDPALYLVSCCRPQGVSKPSAASTGEVRSEAPNTPAPRAPTEVGGVEPAGLV